MKRIALLALPAVAMAALVAALIWPDAPSSGPDAPSFGPETASSAPETRFPGIEALRVRSGNGIATGFAVADGRVVTVAHALDGPVTVRGRRVRVLRVDRGNDLALLSVPGEGATAPDIAGAENGEHLRVVRLRGGRSSSLSVHVRRSIVAHVREASAAEALVRPALELSGRVASGDSGAPVVTGEGALAGIVFAASRTRPDTAYAVDASALTNLLDRP